MAPAPTPHERARRLDRDWRLALTPPGACADPAQAATLDDWRPALAPGTAAQALEAAGLWRRDRPAPLHDEDVWYRAPLPESGPRLLRFEGLATFAEVWVDDAPILTSTSMFQPHEVAADLPAGAELWICFRALAPHLAVKGPRARWRPRMMDPQGLRNVRTTLLGHMPGWCPAIDIVGPWRPIWLVEPGPVRISGVILKPSWTPDGARLEVELDIAGGAGAPAHVHCAGTVIALAPLGAGRFGGAADIPQAEPWWPHTHGDQPLYPARLTVGEIEADLGRVGFRSLELDTGDDGRGFALRVNGEAVFCRGACWIASDLVGLGGATADYETLLRLAVEAGMNMIRVSGVGVYETPAFFAACDALGVMVWQDFMFANFDYPATDPAFAAAVQAEAEAFLSGVQGSPSLSVLCGGSEVLQQAAMLGLATDQMDWPLFDTLLPDVARRLRPDAIYAPNSPSGGALPFVVDTGVGHYYGVGAYERPLEDARRADVRFAAECLAFANVPDAGTLARALPARLLDDPAWKAGVPRDRGASWDFEDVRDHYLQRLYGLDPGALRREAPALYLDLSRAVSGEAMAAVFSEWRRGASRCGGGLVWTLADLAPGAGWGVIDSAGQPKAAWYALKRVLQPVQALLTDEGVNGLDVHLINDRAHAIEAELRLAAFGEEPGPELDVRRPVRLEPRSAIALSSYALAGRFFDISNAYRFGPPIHVAVRAELVAPDGEILSEAIHIRPGVQGWAPDGHIDARLEADGDAWRLTLTSDRFQRLVHIADPAFYPSDDGFCLLPGQPRRIGLHRRVEAGADAAPRGEVWTPGGWRAGRYGAKAKGPDAGASAR